MGKKIFWFAGGVVATILLLKYYGKKKDTQEESGSGGGGGGMFGGTPIQAAPSTPITVETGSKPTNPNPKPNITIADINNNTSGLGSSPITNNYVPNPSPFAYTNTSRTGNAVVNRGNPSSGNMNATGTFGGKSTTSIQAACKCNSKRPRSKSGLVQFSL